MRFRFATSKHLIKIIPMVRDSTYYPVCSKEGDGRSTLSAVGEGLYSLSTLSIVIYKGSNFFCVYTGTTKERL